MDSGGSTPALLSNTLRLETFRLKTQLCSPYTQAAFPSQTSSGDVRLLEEAETTAIPMFILEIFFTGFFPNLFCILEDWEERLV